MSSQLGEFEQLVLLAVLRLGDAAYGVSVAREITERTGRAVALGAIYKAFDRLSAKGFVSSWIGEPTGERGGRRRKHYRLEPAGKEALARGLRATRRMTEGLAPEWQER